MGNGHEPV
jgi:hypothetical protein